MSEMKSAVWAGMDRSGDDLCVENSVREFKIWADVLNYGKKILKNAGIVEADLDAWYLFGQIFGISRAQYFLCARENIAGSTAQKMAAQEQTGNSLESKNALDCVELWLKEKLSAYENTLEKRASRIPLQQILGQQEFMGLTFFVNEHVLIPRQDTETLVELVLNEQKDKNISILDMCTGSGCIAVSLKKLGGYACVEGADISEEALKVAKRNSEEILENSDVNNDAVSSRTEQIQNCTNLTNNQNKQDNSEERMVSEVRRGSQTGVTFRHSDMFSSFRETEQFNVIVSNPPYVPSAVIEELEPEVRDHEPRGALDGTADGLYFYRILAEECAKHLTPGGHVYFEIGYDQGMAVKELLDNHGFKDTRVIQDLTGKDRVVCGTWQTTGV
ncbi:N5-glutamine methyltransferase family protein [Pilosibacter fragilis]|uniref:N5-glutamine methyltransferase family protein n=1 Tax=Pilosibacter fragilis TaxID=3078042 RepID=UPI0001CE5A85|nr:protein-(glutamine-N5) methyltransferase, release factor-specific [butyrate-producing bacterium SS3/4]SCH44346.1 Release factor glutamine methyltransferase [uncultured Clostridium sp.]